MYSNYDNDDNYENYGNYDSYGNIIEFPSNYQQNNNDSNYQKSNIQDTNVYQTRAKQKTYTNEYEINQQNQSDKLDYKNLPKMIGNNLEKYIEANMKQDPNNNNNERIQETKGVKQFMSNRKQNITNKKISKPKQVSTKISDLRDFCAADRQSSKIFRQYIKQQMFIDLIQSPKIQDPMKYKDGISIYYATAKEPEKMISSKIKFSDNKRK